MTGPSRDEIAAMIRDYIGGDVEPDGSTWVHGPIYPNDLADAIHALITGDETP